MFTFKAIIFNKFVSRLNVIRSFIDVFCFPIKSPLSGYYQLMFEDTTSKFRGSCGNLHGFFLVSADKLG